MTREAAVQTIHDTYNPASKDEKRATVGTLLLARAIDESGLDWPFDLAADIDRWESLPARILWRLAELCLAREEHDHVQNAELCIP